MSSYRKTPEAIIRYLRRLDTYLSRPVKLTVVGGTAIALRGSHQHATTDIDIFESVLPEHLQRAIAAAGDEDRIEISPVGALVTAPYTFEDRIEAFAIEGLSQLQVVLPEAHDLAIMKIGRGLTHDLEGVEEIHAHEPLNKAILLERYREAQHIGSEVQFRLAFLEAIERLFGEDAAAEMQGVLNAQD